MYLYYFIIFSIILIILNQLFYSKTDHLVCILASSDGNRYCVRRTSDRYKAANLLAKINLRIEKLINYLHTTQQNDLRTKLLIQRYSPSSLQETLPTSELTAYSENKGDTIAFCLNRTKKNNSKLIDENTLYFVALHELSHLCTESIGHKTEFWQNFRWLLIQAKNAKLYTPIDYSSNPTTYCGMKIDDNPYYDLK